MKLTTDLHPLPWLRMSRAIPPLPLCLHGIHRDSFTFGCTSSKRDSTFSLVHTGWIFSDGNCYKGNFSLYKYAVQNQIITITFSQLSTGICHTGICQTQILLYFLIYFNIGNAAKFKTLQQLIMFPPAILSKLISVMYEHSGNTHPCTTITSLTDLTELTTTNYSLACNRHIVISKYLPHIHMFLELNYSFIV